MVAAGEPAWRGRQLAEALYRQRIAELDAITTLPKALRQRLAAEGWQVGRPAIAQVFQSWTGRSATWSSGGRRWSDRGNGLDAGGRRRRKRRRQRGERKCRNSPCPIPRILRTWEANHELGSTHETGEEVSRRHSRHRATICVSSQVGCAVNCQFCLTAKLGLQRNLTAGEIAGQVLAVFDRHAVEVGRDRVNLVFMGMGEPFLNYDNFMGAVRLLVREAGLSPQRMTVSTSGIVPGIERFAPSRRSCAPSWPSA
jgi:23S rRNA (adenine2503-C2)-methyltransferase